jgi:hypothetical protein
MLEIAYGPGTVGYFDAIALEKIDSGSKESR